MDKPDYRLLDSQVRALFADEVDSRSEIVVPLTSNGTLIGVLDIDSPTPDRFSEIDQQGVEMLCDSFCELQSERRQFI